MTALGWCTDPGLLLPSYSSYLLKILKHVNQKKGVGFGGAKTAYSSFDSVFKADQLAPNHRSEKFDGCLAILVHWPFGFQKTVSFGLGFTG